MEWSIATRLLYPAAYTSALEPPCDARAMLCTAYPTGAAITILGKYLRRISPTPVGAVWNEETDA